MCLVYLGYLSSLISFILYHFSPPGFDPQDYDQLFRFVVSYGLEQLHFSIKKVSATIETHKFFFFDQVCH